jgi:hypothetical protein
MNTPQFSWLKSRLPRKAQPVPPIYEPEVGAEAIFWAAHNVRRELFVGMPTLKAMVGNRLIPGLLDHYLGKKGYEFQQTDEPDDPRRAYNLWEPVPGRYAARGAFSACAHSSSFQSWLGRHRGFLGAGILAGAAGLLLARALKSKEGKGSEPSFLQAKAMGALD